jgi:hypothetical protein
MALVSPGVQITVTDESNYAPNAIGSVGYILLATAQDKTAPGGTAIAAGTLAENAGKIYTITSQRDLVTTFGTPTFYTTSSGAPINGDERNEYGLMTAYSLLGVSNQVYIQRADVDLSQLEGTTTRPLANPSSGSFWLNTTDTDWGVYVWNATTQEFGLQSVRVITSTDELAVDEFTPSTDIGTIGDFAVNTVDPTNPIFQKRYDNTWHLVGTIGWQDGVGVVTGSAVNPEITANSSIYINTDTVSFYLGDDATAISAAINNANVVGVSSSVVNGQIVVYGNEDAMSDGSTPDGIVRLTNNSGTPLATIGITAGYYACGAVQIAPYYSVPDWQTDSAIPRPTGSVWQKASTLGSGLNVSVSTFNGVTQLWDTANVYDYDTVFAATYGLDPTGGGLNVSAGSIFAQYNVFGNTTVGTQLWYRIGTGATVGTGATTSPAAPSSGNEFTVQTRPSAISANTSTYTVSIVTGTVTGFVQAVLAANIPSVSASVTSSGAVSLTHALGGDMIVTDTVGSPLANVGFTTSGTNVYADPTSGSDSLIISNWEPLAVETYTVSATQPYVAPANDTYWYYNTPSRADIMISNGSAWVGYRTLGSDIRGYNLTLTNTAGPIISTAEPTEQDDGTDLEFGDLWLDTSDLENYPKLYRWQSLDGVSQWVLIDNTDATGQNGIIFGDARWSTTGNVNPVTGAIPSIASLALSNYVDLDAPDAALYPRGMLLFNTRASGYNVKQYKTSYFTSAAYPNETLPGRADTWVSVSGYQSTGVPNFGRKAPRGVIVAALKATIDSSTSLREDQNNFNLIACPSYPELIPNMIALNDERKNTAFIVGDTPMRLPATGTAIQGWANNNENATETGEVGLSTSTVSPYVGLYYPSGQTNDLAGNSIVVPPSYMALRTIMRSDNVSYQWLAPAGTRRGIVDNVSAIGYINSTSGEFVSIGVTQGLRDTLYNNKINPITKLPGTGITVFGQKTLATDNTSLDRINVARLINYIRKNLDVAVRPFLFEPNDPITRAQVIAVSNSLLNDLVAKRGITDYLVVCDTTNNTPFTISRNELFVDIAIQPTKAVEFIYIPIRIKNAGEIQSGNLASANATGTGA